MTRHCAFDSRIKAIVYITSQEPWGKGGGRRLDTSERHRGGDEWKGDEGQTPEARQYAVAEIRYTVGARLPYIQHPTFS